MLVLLAFLAFTYFICSLQLSGIITIHIPHNMLGKMIVKLIRHVRHLNFSKKSCKLFFTLFGHAKYPFFVILSGFLFERKYIVDLTAIVAYMGYYFPIWSGFRCSNNNGFIGVICTGFILDYITGIGMLLSYFISARSFGYTSVAVVSAMMVGMIKTIVHIVVFDNTDYFEAAFFMLFGMLAICKNRRMLKHICGATVKQDIKFYKSVCKFFSKKNDAKRNAYKTEKKLVEKKNTDEQKVKKSARYRNYKKIYKNNLKFIEDDRIYEKPYRNHLSFKNVANK